MNIRQNVWKVSCRFCQLFFFVGKIFSYKQYTEKRKYMSFLWGQTKLSLIAGLARVGQSPILMEYGQPLFVWLTRDWPSVRTYAWGRGGYQKEGRGVSGVVFASPHLLYRTLSIWSIDSCQNRIATDQYAMTISRAHVSTHRSDVICLETVRWPVNCFTRSRTMFNLILFS